MRRRTLELLPGLRWRGKLHVTGRTEGGYLVDFDAEDPTAVQERYVYDYTVLTAQQIEGWTGVKLGGEG